MSEANHIGWISRRGLRALNAGHSPTIHKNQGGKFDIPIYLGSRVQFNNSEAALAAAHEQGRAEMRLEILGAVS